MDDVTATEYQNTDNQLQDTELCVGDETQQLASEMIGEGMEGVVSTFYKSVHAFYCTFVSTLIKTQS